MLWHSLAQVRAAGLAVEFMFPTNRTIIASTKPTSKFLIFILDSLIRKLRQFATVRWRGLTANIAILLEARAMRTMRKNTLPIRDVAIIETVGTGIKRFNIPAGADVK